MFSLQKAKRSTTCAIMDAKRFLAMEGIVFLFAFMWSENSGALGIRGEAKLDII